MVNFATSKNVFVRSRTPPYGIHKQTWTLRQNVEYKHFLAPAVADGVMESRTKLTGTSMSYGDKKNLKKQNKVEIKKKTG